MAWKLTHPTRVDKFSLAGSNVFRQTVEYTVYGDENGLFLAQDGSVEIPFGTKYIWQGGHQNITNDAAIRDLWTQYGYQWTVV